MDTLETTCNGLPLNGRTKVSKSKEIVSKKTYRKVAFTSFACTLHLHFQSVFYDNISKIKYLIVGLETCPSTGRQHMQGFIHLNSGYKMSSIKAIIGDDTAHIEAIKGTIEQNIKYCKKENDYREYGTPQYQGKRNDIVESLKKYNNLQDYIKNEPTLYVKYRSGIEGYYRNLGVDYVPLDDKPVVIWLYGDTGKGKSRIVRDYLKAKIAEGYRVWRRPLGATAWFDGYSNQDIVFLDEVRGSTYKFDDLLQLLDYDCPQVPVKGAFVSFNPKVILITSNAHPKRIYEHVNDENKQQLVRRCDKIIHLKEYTPGLLTT